MAKFTVLLLCVLLFLSFLSTDAASSESSEENDVVDVPSCCGFSSPLVVKKDQWKPIIATKFGKISTVQIGDGCGGKITPYTIHSITLEPNALLLPLLLHSDMVFFVQSGSGILNWVEEEKETSSEIRRGDVYRLRPGTVFYLQRKSVEIDLGIKLRVYAIFSNTEECLHDPCFGAYSNIRDLLFSFDETILQSTFGVPGDIIGLMRNRTKPPLIIQDVLSIPDEANTWQLQPRFLRTFADDIEDLVMGSAENKKKKKKKEKKTKKAKTFNVFESEPDFESLNGQSLTVNTKDLKVLKGSRVGVFMVNLTQGSMMAPHWNPWACEISIVLKGAGMVRVTRSSISSSSSSPLPTSECKNERYKVEEGDIFAVPRFHPVAQMSFNNESLVFIGFTTSAKKNEPQFLAGESSLLQSLDHRVLAASLNVSSVFVDVLMQAQKEAAVLGCPNCAELEFEKFKVEMEMQWREDEREREGEEAKKEEEEEKERWPPQPQPSQEPPQKWQPLIEKEGGMAGDEEWQAGEGGGGYYAEGEV